MTQDGTGTAPRRTAAEDVYLALKREILTLEVKPKAPLKEQALASRFGTSRVPVREACRRLQQERLVDSIPYKGYFVSGISLRELSDCFDLRAVLETHALRAAFRRAGPEDVPRLAALATVGYSRSDRDSWEVFLARNTEFHLGLAALSGNERLVRMLSDLLESMQRYFCLGLAGAEYGAEMRAEHEELTERVRQGGRDEAVACLAGQIERSRERILGEFLRVRADLAIP